MSPSPSTTLLRTQSDERLMALARAGHERAFEAIVERYRKPLLRACRRVLPEARAEDAVQQALLAAWTALRRGDQVRELRPWLYRIVRNTALNASRTSGYDHEELLGSLRAAGGPQEEAERRAIVRHALTGVAALPERQREALLRTALGGLSHEEVARELGLSDGAVRQLVHRARVSLRAAATALTPLQFAHLLGDAGARAEPLAQRVGELVAGAAPAGVAAMVAKASAVALLAGGAATTPALVDGGRDRAPTAAVRQSDRDATGPVHTAEVIAIGAALREDPGGRPGASGRRRAGRAAGRDDHSRGWRRGKEGGERRHGFSGDDERRDGEHDERAGSGKPHDDEQRPDGDGHDPEEPDHQESGSSSSDSGSSHSGSSDPAPDPDPDPDPGGSDSGASDDDLAGSGSTDGAQSEP